MAAPKATARSCGRTRSRPGRNRARPPARTAAPTPRSTTLRGRQIGATLGIESDVSSSECLGCHATDRRRAAGRSSSCPTAWAANPATARRQAGCRRHYTVGASHAANVAAGHDPARAPRGARARSASIATTAAPTSGQFVSHRIMAAGHPRLSFELDLFSALQQHHDADADYVRAQGPPEQRAAVGGRPGRGGAPLAVAVPPAAVSARKGMFPEFYFFDCHSCHRADHRRAAAQADLRDQSRAADPRSAPRLTTTRT